MNTHYDKKYFDWQKTIGEFGGQANLFKFEKYIKDTDTVLDFGCGGGYLLKNINTNGRKIGIEINPNAKEIAESNGVEVYSCLYDIPNESVDVIISNHALEHTDYPLDILKEFKRVLKKEGIVIVVVPHEYSKKVNRLDQNMHLYTWSPQTLFNLFKQADILPIEAETICHMWMPHYQKIQQLFGWNIFHILCKIYCFINGKGYQTKVVGRK